MVRIVVDGAEAFLLLYSDAKSTELLRPTVAPAIFKGIGKLFLVV